MFVSLNQHYNIKSPSVSHSFSCWALKFQHKVVQILKFHFNLLNSRPTKIISMVVKFNLKHKLFTSRLHNWPSDLFFTIWLLKSMLGICRPIHTCTHTLKFDNRVLQSVVKSLPRQIFCGSRPALVVGEQRRHLCAEENGPARAALLVLLFGTHKVP